MSKDAELFKKLTNRTTAHRETAQAELNDNTTPTTETQPKKRGRPATGKRSDPEWIGRTYYIRRETDLDVEDELLKLKRSGVELDKSELVDALLTIYVKWRKGENIENQLDEISPR